MLTATLYLSPLWPLKHTGEDSNTNSDWFYSNVSEQQHPVPATSQDQRSQKPAFTLLQLWNTLFHALLRGRLSINNTNSSSFFVVNLTCQSNELVKWQTYIVRNISGVLKSFLPKSLPAPIWFWLFPSPPISLPMQCVWFIISGLLHCLLSDCVILPSAWRNMGEMCT